jgi:hypothetical protein
MSSILALIPRCCTEKISLPARWMICAQNNASEMYSRQTASDAGDFSFAAASSLQRGIQPLQGLPFPALPNHPFPLPGTFLPSRFASVRACQGFIPVQTKRPPEYSTVEPQTERGNRARDVNGENTAHPRICFSGVKVSSREEKLEKLETAGGNIGGHDTGVIEASNRGTWDWGLWAENSVIISGPRNWSAWEIWGSGRKR